MTALSVRALLFTDIEGSTGLVRGLGDRFEGVLERHHAIIRSAVADGGGVEQSREGDSLFITFRSATAALEGAAEAQLRIEQEPWPLDGRVRVRMGLHVGEVAETRAGLVGLAIHQAARIMRAAHGGQIVVSGDVVRQAGSLPDGITVRSIGTYDLRDIGRVPLHQVEHRDLQHEFPELRSSRAVAHNLPVPLTALVGRVAEGAAVEALLGEHRLVTLLGPGGCGKTRLALVVAAASLESFVDGVWFVDLGALSPGADVTSRVAEVLGVHGGLDELIAALAEREALLVLDNCEHVVESVAGFVTGVLSESSTARVMSTSRSPLGVAGEARYHVPPLAVPSSGAELREAQATDAVRLFTRRAELVRPGFQLGEHDAEAIVEVCRRLDGLPLAIELAAARLSGMSLAELVVRFVDRFGVLVGGPRTAPERHQTLRNTVEWSFRLLDADEQHVLCHLASFRGGCDVESAEAVCANSASSPGGVLGVLVRLAEKSLVTTLEADGVTRYRLHETIREYVLDSVSDSERATIADRHARWFATLASTLRGGPTPGGERAWIRRHDAERENFRAAADRLLVHDPPAGLRLLLDIEPGIDFTPQSGWLDEMLRSALALPVSYASGDRAHAFGMLAWDAAAANAVELAEQALQLLTDVEDPLVECAVLTAVARCHVDAAGGTPDSDEIAAACAAADRAGGTYWPIMVREFLSRRVPASTAESLNAEALRLADSLHLELFASLLRGNLAMVAQIRGEGAEALAMWRQLVPMIEDLVAFAGGDNACFYALAEGEHGELAVGLHVAEHFALELTRRSRDLDVATRLHSVVAHLRRLAGDIVGAETALDHADRLGKPRWDFLGGLALITRSALCRNRGEPQAAAAVIEQARWHIGFRGLTDIEMRVIEELAAVALDLGRQDDAANLLATARNARQRDHKPLSPACRPEVYATRATLGDGHGNVLDASEVIALTQEMVGAPSP